MNSNHTPGPWHHRHAAPTISDFQGRFLRGSGGNAAAIGTEQGDAIRNITGTFSTQSPVTGNDGVFSGTSGTQYVTGVSWASGKSRFIFDASAVVPTAAENRPMNYAVILAIKY
jgi:hypothetical protein